MKEKVTIREIAEMANVSVSSVSNVLNGKDTKISKDTKEKILRIIEESNYQPDFSARALSGGRSNLIGLIVSEHKIKGGDLENPFYFEFLLGARRNIAFEDYDIIVANSLKEKEYKSFVKKRKIEGLVLIGRFSDETYKEIDELGIPVVSIDEIQTTIKNSINIMSDNYKGGFLAGEYAVSQGHKNMAVISGDISLGICKERYEGFLKALINNGLIIKKENILMEEVSYIGGVNCIDKLKDEGVTFIFSTADIMAIGAVNRLVSLGKKIPEDISVIGFDDVDACRYVQPNLTTIRQDIVEKGSVAVDRLRKAIEDGKGLYEEKDTILPVKFVLRDSVKKI